MSSISSKQRLKAELRAYILSDDLLSDIARNSLRVGDTDFLETAKDILKEAQESLENGILSLSLARREAFVRERLRKIGAISYGGSSMYHLYGDSRTLCGKKSVRAYEDHGRFHMKDPIRLGGSEVFNSLCGTCKGSTQPEKDGERKKWDNPKLAWGELAPIWARIFGYSGVYPNWPTVHLLEPGESKFLCTGEKIPVDSCDKGPLPRAKWCPDCLEEITLEALIEGSK
ncbi:MAG: hypothetical protein GF334_03620 [Candidatus Altiarchaeales archaeon]|nr:hypothetical protein [Candidatus Altiarchaeales archaeon]